MQLKLQISAAAMIQALPFLLIAGLFSSLSMQTTGAEEQYSSWHLGTIQATDTYHPGEMQSQGSIIIDEFHADARGGFVRLRAKRSAECLAGGVATQGWEMQQFKFSWTFEQDVSLLFASSGPIHASFTIEADEGRSCLDENPYMSLQADTDPIAQTPDGENRFYFKTSDPSHQPGTRTIRVYRGESWRKNAFFMISINNFKNDGTGEFLYVIKYPYEGAHDGLTTPPPQQQLVEPQCFAADPKAGFADRATHVAWARQRSAVTPRKTLLLRVDLLFRCPVLSPESLARAFADISVVIARYVPNAQCFGGDADTVSPDWSAHNSFAVTNERQKDLENLKWKIGAAFDCLDTSQHVDFFADVSVAIAKTSTVLRTIPEP